MKHSLKNNYKYYLMLLPALVLSASVVLLPGIMTVVSSFTDWNGISSDMNFVGLENYYTIFGNKVFRKALFNNFTWLIIFLTIPVAIALVVAVCLLRRTRTRTFYQVVFLIPYIVAPIANALLWMSMIYSPLTGVFGFLKNLGFDISSPLSQTNSALAGVAAIDAWHYWGFLAAVFLASLRQTPGDQIESAVVEGANGWQLFRHIYFPSLLPTFRLMMILIVIQSFLTFDYVYLTTQGGPARATEMLSTLAYTYSFSMFQFGRAAAVSMVMAFFGLIASVAYVRFNRRDEQA